MGLLRLSDLEPQLLVFYEESDGWHARKTNSLAEANAVRFKCPKCYLDGVDGIHQLECLSPDVPKHHELVGPGRWALDGESLDNLTLIGATSDSVRLKGGCKAHFFVRNGIIEMVKG